MTDSQSEARPIFDAENEKALVDADPEIVDAVAEAHQGTLDYIRSEVAETEAPITSYFAQVLDDPSVQLVNQAQTWYTEKAVQGTEYEGLPILSAGGLLLRREGVAARSITRTSPPERWRLKTSPTCTSIRIRSRWSSLRAQR